MSLPYREKRIRLKVTMQETRHRCKARIVCPAISFMVAVVSTVVITCILMRNTTLSSPVDMLMIKNSSCAEPGVALSTTTYVTVCIRENEYIVDIRVFLAGKATIKGIPLTMQEWKTLLTHRATITRLLTSTVRDPTKSSE